MTTPPAPAQCGLSWCNNHHTGNHAEDTWCRRTAVGGFGSVSLELDRAGQPLVSTYCVDVDEFDLAQAEEFFRAGLALVEAARQTVAA